MVLLESHSIPIGTKMPGFSLEDSYGVSHCSSSLIGEKGLLLVFTCNHCPYAIAVWDRLIRLANTYGEQGVETVAINPNIHPQYPADSPENMRQLISDRGIEFPYLVDDTQSVARQYGAQCTPDIYLLNQSFELVYHGRIDDSWQDESKVTCQDLDQAMSNLVLGDPILNEQIPSMGCSIKWQ